MNEFAREVRLEDVLAVLNSYEAEASAKAAKANHYNKPLMSGYWKAVAIHVRHLRRRIRKLSNGGKP